MHLPETTRTRDINEKIFRRSGTRFFQNCTISQVTLRMFHVVLLFCILNTYLSAASKLLPPKDYEIIKINTLEEVGNLYKDRLANDENVVFHILSTGTFLTRRIQKYWDVEETVQDLQREGYHPQDKTLRKIYKSSRLYKGLRKIFKPPPVPYVEFYFTNFTVEKSRQLLPVSPCHSEINGEGSIIKMQLTEIDRIAPQGTIGVPKPLQLFLSSGEADIALEDESLSMVSLKCNLAHGEIGQIFLRNTAFFYYNSWYRTVLYDRDTHEFSTNDQFKKRDRQRMVLKGGLGEWLCATHKIIQLQCFNVIRDITIPETPSLLPNITYPPKNIDSAKGSNKTEIPQSVKNNTALFPIHNKNKTDPAKTLNRKYPQVKNMDQFRKLKSQSNYKGVWLKSSNTKTPT